MFDLSLFLIRNATEPPIRLPIAVNGSGPDGVLVALPEIAKLSTYRSGVLPVPLPPMRIIWMPIVCRPTLTLLDAVNVRRRVVLTLNWIANTDTSNEVSARSSMQVCCA